MNLICEEMHNWVVGPIHDNPSLQIKAKEFLVFGLIFVDVLPLFRVLIVSEVVA
jgi:hypothetical protein